MHDRIIRGDSPGGRAGRVKVVDWGWVRGI